MAITQALCNSFKKELLEGLHNFSVAGDVIKIALYTSSADLGATTTAYTTSGEVSDAGTNYTAGGETLASVDPSLSGTTAVTDFADVAWPSASFTTRGALVYNSTQADRAIMVLDFGVDKTVSVGAMTVTFPDADSTNAIIRIA
tara:strand:- start:406 stop:837 length:432 start_codon:yes stop_codon:yes gene_type:complete